MAIRVIDGGYAQFAIDFRRTKIQELDEADVETHRIVEHLGEMSSRVLVYGFQFIDRSVGDQIEPVFFLK